MKVNLDEEYEKWRKEHNLNDLYARENISFTDFIEREWQRFQDENGLIDKSNKDIQTEKISLPFKSR